MQYPKQLPKHPIYNFNLDMDLISIKNKNDEISSYYHFFDNTRPVLEMHIHDFYEINIVLDNPIVHYINGHIYHVSPGTVFVIPPNTEHGYYSNTSMRVLHILIKNNFLAKHNENFLTLKGYSFLFNIEPLMRSHSNSAAYLTLSENELKYISSLTSRLIEYENLNKKSRQFMKETLLLNIVSELCLYANNLTQDNEILSDISQTIVSAMEYMNSHLAEKINLNDVANMVNMSYATFYRHFKQMCKLTPVQYLAIRRVDKAVNLLQQDSLSMSEISQMCGFFDVSHFSRTFKQIKGISPNNFKSRSMSS